MRNASFFCLTQKKRHPKVPPLMFSQRNNPYCDLLKICSTKIHKIHIQQSKKSLNLQKAIL